MTLHCAVRVAIDDQAVDDHDDTALIERGSSLTDDTLGLTLAEGHALLHGIQTQLVTAQMAVWQAANRPCPGCGVCPPLKDRRPIIMRTIFGTQTIMAERLRRCGCGGDKGAGATVTPLAEMLVHRTSPELLYLETRWGSLMSYGLAARMLNELLSLDRPIAAERVRRDLYAEARAKRRIWEKKSKSSSTAANSICSTWRCPWSHGRRHRWRMCARPGRLLVRGDRGQGADVIPTR